jgi:asparagine synthase (glutamine-hydrolysing)
LSRLPDWGHPRSTYRRGRRFAQGAVLPFEQRLSRWVSVFYDDLTQLMPDLTDSVAAYAQEGVVPWARRSAHASRLTQALYVNFKTYLLDDLLVKMDRCSMAHALEARSPFLDRELIEYVFGLPDVMKLRGWATKVILKRAFADLLPPQILSRGKMGFGVPLHQWFRTDLREFLGDLLLPADARLGRYVDRRYVNQLVTEHLVGASDHSHRLWMLLTFEVWLRQMGCGAFHAPVPQTSLAAQ